MIRSIEFKCMINSDTIPMTSFSLRMRDNTPSYLQVVTKDSSNASRINMAVASGTAELHVYVRINKGSWVDIFYVTLETARQDIGPNNYSITLTGHRTYNFTDASTVTPDDYKYISTGGTVIVRCSPTTIIYPGQRLVIASEGVDINPVDQVSINVGNGTYTQEVSE